MVPGQLVQRYAAYAVVSRSRADVAAVLPRWPLSGRPARQCPAG